MNNKQIFKGKEEATMQQQPPFVPIIVLKGILPSTPKMTNILHINYFPAVTFVVC